MRGALGVHAQENKREEIENWERKGRKGTEKGMYLVAVQ